jgi:hypothetical protein
MGDPTGPHHARSRSRSCSGVTPASAWRSWARASPPPASPASARPSRSWSGCRSATARRRRRSAPSASSEPDAGSDVGGCAPAPSTTRPRTSGCSTAPRPGSPTAASPTSTWWWPWSTPSSARRATPASSSARHPGPVEGQKYKKHGIRASHTAEVVLDDVRIPGGMPARRQGEARRALARREGKPGNAQAAMQTFEATRPAWAPRPSASPGPPTSTRSSTPRSATRSASRSS